MSSEYEKNVTKLIQEKLDKLEYLKKAENWDNSQVLRLVNEIETLESLFENYNLGMNYFRRARGGRSGLRECEFI
jgi:colicin import membrane protein